jgi:hypothetical protein
MVGDILHYAHSIATAEKGDEDAAVEVSSTDRA